MSTYHFSNKNTFKSKTILSGIPTSQHCVDIGCSQVSKNNHAIVDIIVVYIILNCVEIDKLIRNSHLVTSNVIYKCRSIGMNIKVIHSILFVFKVMLL